MVYIIDYFQLSFLKYRRK